MLINALFPERAAPVSPGIKGRLPSACMYLAFPGRDKDGNTHPVLPSSFRVFPDDWLKTGHKNLAGILKINI